jgi:predicted ATPase
MINKISFKNYKLFKEKQTLELKPITILIGKNNSGKSAVLKLPVLISNSLEGLPINWKYKIGEDSVNSIELGTDFKDLVYNRNEKSFIEFSVSNDKDLVEVALNKEDGVLEYKLNSNEIDASSDFKGFLLDGKKIEGLNFSIDYLGAIRIEPDSDYVFSNDVYEKIGIKGQNAYPILVNDFINTSELINKVSDWYRANFENWQLNVIETKTVTETKYEIAISNSVLNSINIKQTGQGIHQVLPLVVRTYLEDAEPTLIVIEEPETHLHPAAHGNLAERFVDSFLENNNKNYLIETHSQNFVLRMRRLVAEGKLKSEQLAIYYVDFNEELNESTLERIKIDDGGGVERWPDGIFSETTIETRAIYNAQINDIKNVGRDS